MIYYISDNYCFTRLHSVAKNDKNTMKEGCFMKKKLLSIIMALVMCLSVLPLATSAAITDNLLTNPSFENGLDGWTSPDGKWSTVEEESGYEPQDGNHFAWPTGANRENTYIYQDVSLNGHNVGETLIFNVMVCNYDQAPHDMGQVVVKFLDASGNTVKEYIQQQRNPDWNSQTIIATLPTGAVTARIELWAIWYVGGDVDAYYDDASVVVTTEKYNLVYITEKDGKETAKEGDTLYLTADNSISKNPLDYTWSSSYEIAATVDENGVVTVYTEDEFAIYAKDKASMVVGVYWVNSENENLKPAAGSSWASAGLAEADAMGLIPDCLKGADLTKPITRAEFAAVAVKAYEALSGVTELPSTDNPFTDTNDSEVVKAFNLGITAGISVDKFAPDTLLNREQAATMLTRTFKRATMDGWTLQTDGSFPLTYEKPAPFADDAYISDWAKDSVYFMAANGIITGIGENRFAPKNTTTEEQAIGYADATRQQALIIATRMVKNLK